MGDDLSTRITDLEMQLKSLDMKVESNKLDVTKQLSDMKDSIAKLHESFAAGQKVQEPWQTEHKELRKLCLEAMMLAQNFETFSIELVTQGCNGGAITAAEEAVPCLLENQEDEEKFH